MCSRIDVTIAMRNLISAFQPRAGVALFVLLAGLLLAPLAVGRADGLRGKRPNVIVFLTDNQGYGDISAHGNPRSLPACKRSWIAS